MSTTVAPQKADAPRDFAIPYAQRARTMTKRVIITAATMAALYVAAEAVLVLGGGLSEAAVAPVRPHNISMRSGYAGAVRDITADRGTHGGYNLDLPPIQIHKLWPFSSHVTGSVSEWCVYTTKTSVAAQSLSGDPTGTCTGSVHASRPWVSLTSAGSWDLHQGSLRKVITPTQLTS